MPESMDSTLLPAKRRRISPLPFFDDITSMTCCILDGNNDVNLNILDQCENLSICDQNGNTLLHLILSSKESTWQESIKILQMLLKRGFDPNIKNNFGLTALHLTVERRMRATIELLIEHRANVHDSDKQGNTVAHFFIISEQQRYKTLLQYADSTSSLKNEEVMEYEIAKFVEWLILKGFDFDRANCNGDSAMHMAIKMNLQHLLPTLLRYSTDLNFVTDKKQNLLHLFIEANKNSQNQQLVTRFTDRYAIEIINILLHRGVSVDAVTSYEMTVLDLTLEANVDSNVLDMILELFTNVHHKNYLGQTLLHRIIAGRLKLRISDDECFKVISALVAKGSDVNNKDILKSRILHEFVSQAKHVEKLLDILSPGGLNMNSRGSDGQSILHKAISEHNISMAKNLIKRGADINCRKNLLHWTPLLMAMYMELGELVEFLLINGANVNCRDPRTGKRPVHFIAEDIMDNSELLKKILENGAYAHLRDKQKRSALFLATINGNDSVVKLLLEYGADINDPFVIREVQPKSPYHFWDESVEDIILQHWIKLEAAGLPCSEKYQNKIGNDNFEYFRKKCLREINILKNTRITNHTSLYQWLHMACPRRKCASIHNEKLQSLINSSIFQQQFPIYSVIILANYRDAAGRKYLLESAKIAWLKLTKLGLPDICLENIFYYLSNTELSNMIYK